MHKFVSMMLWSIIDHPQLKVGAMRRLHLRLPSGDMRIGAVILGKYNFYWQVRACTESWNITSVAIRMLGQLLTPAIPFPIQMAKGNIFEYHKIMPFLKRAFDNSVFAM